MSAVPLNKFNTLQSLFDEGELYTLTYVRQRLLNDPSYFENTSSPAPEACSDGKERTS